jgi:hypothetical protein
MNAAAANAQPITGVIVLATEVCVLESKPEGGGEGGGASGDREFYDTQQSARVRASDPKHLVGEHIKVGDEMGVVTAVVAKVGSSTLHTIDFGGRVENVHLAKRVGGPGTKFYVARDLKADAKVDGTESHQEGGKGSKTKQACDAVEDEFGEGDDVSGLDTADAAGAASGLAGVPEGGKDAAVKAMAAAAEASHRISGMMESFVHFIMVPPPALSTVCRSNHLLHVTGELHNFLNSGGHVA